MNGPAIGVILKDIVRRAIEIIWAEQFVFEMKAKEGYSGKLDDLVTSADGAAQRVYVKLLRECFPTFGIIAEENELSIPCTHDDHNIYFTVDPLDGTKAFGRRQSHGVGTMISLVMDEDVIAAYVGDVMTGEIYGYRPGSEKVHRISKNGNATCLNYISRKPMSESHILFREDPNKHSIMMRKLARGTETTGMFKGIEVTGGSIGISMARLWKGEVAACVLKPSYETPWDSSPVIGICKKLGFVFTICNQEIGYFSIQDIDPPTEVYRREQEILVVHLDNIESLNTWAQAMMLTC